VTLEVVVLTEQGIDEFLRVHFFAVFSSNDLNASTTPLWLYYSIPEMSFLSVPS
jgi:hypothetical protein